MFSSLSSSPSSPPSSSRILIFLFLLFTISIVNANTSKFISRNPLSPIIHNPIISRDIPVQKHEHDGKGKAKNNDPNNGIASKHSKHSKHPKHPKNHPRIPKNSKHQKHPETPKAQEQPYNPKDQKDPKAPKGEKGPKNSKAPKGEKDPKDPKGEKDPKDPKNPKGEKDPKDPKNPKGEKGPKGPKNPIVEKDPKDPKNPKGEKGPKDPKNPIGEKGPKDPKNPKGEKGPKDPKNPKGGKDPKDPKNPKGEKGPKDPKNPKGAKDPTKDPKGPDAAPDGTPQTPATPPPPPSTPPSPPPPPSPTPKNYNIMYYKDYPVYSANSYLDGPIILRLTKDMNQGCNGKSLYLRLVYDDATVKPIDFNHEIPNFNFCQYGENNDDLIRIFPLNKELNNGFFLISYLQKDESSELYQEIGLIVDWDGQVKSQLVLSSIVITNTDTSQLGKAVVNSNPQNGFIWVNRIQKDTIQWTNYSSPDDDGKVNVQGDPRTTKIFEKHKFEMFPTLDGGYGYITAGRNPDLTELQAKTLPEFSIVPSWVVNVRFIRPYTNEITQPSLIHQRVSPATDMDIKSCDNAYDSPGLMCIISIKINEEIVYYVKIKFLSDGSTREPIKVDIDTSKISVDHIYPLCNGGYVVSGKLKSAQQVTSTGYIYYSQGDYYGEWDLPRIVGNSVILQGAFPNNTFWMFSNSELNENTSDDSGWNLMTTNIPKLVIPFDQGYNNLNVNTTSPKINSAIDIGTNSLSITYYKPVSFSLGNISIYQHDFNGQLILRQSYSTNTQFTILSQDKKTITLIALNNTFNNPGKSYTIVVDDNTVKDSSYEEPLLGIPPNLWKFTTENKPQQHKKSEHALARLTFSASFYFRDLNDSQKSNFVQSLLNDLAKCVPIPPNRLYTNTRFQWDPDVGSKQILLKFEILPGSNEQELSAETIIDTLDNMIKYRDVSSISHFQYSSMLDSNYGFVHKRSVWDKYEFKLFAVGAILLLLGILAMLSYRKSDDGNSFVSFKVLLIALDFVLDFAFVINHSRDVYILYYPSLLTFMIPLGFNTIITFFILIRELSNNTEFYSWFRTYHNVAAIFTFCSIVDVESLTMINSKLAGLAAFDAPISNSTQNWILVTSVWNFIIEDTPHLTIQILYIILSVNYDIIPFLNLISASLLWICVLFGRSYHLILYYKKRRNEERELMTEYGDINNNGSSGNNNGNGNGNQIRRVEYVLSSLEDISPANIRPPSWWLSKDQQYSSRNIPNDGVSGNNESNNGAGVTSSDYQLLERRSSLPINNGPFGDENEIGVPGPSTIYDRTKNDSEDTSSEIIDENTNTSLNGNGKSRSGSTSSRSSKDSKSSKSSKSSKGYKRIYDDVNGTNQDLENIQVIHEV